jgi:hypothetical protein
MPAAVRAHEEQRVSLDDDNICGHETPPFGISALEEQSSMFVKLILFDEERKESASVDEDVFH